MRKAVYNGKGYSNANKQSNYKENTYELSKR